VTRTRSGPRWRHIFHWPLFCALAAVHILLLPLLLNEREDDIVSIVAGLLYLGFAVADWRADQRTSPE